MTNQMTTIAQQAYANSNCSKSCVAVSFPASPAMSSTMVPIPYCQSIKDYTCLNIEMRKVFYEINENCPGKRTFMLETDNNTKYYVGDLVQKASI